MTLALKFKNLLRSPALGRTGAAILGGYAFCWGFIALGVTSLYGLGLAFHDAETLSAILAFLAYLASFLWAFGAGSQLRVWLTLVGGGAVMSGLAALIQHRLLA